MKTSRKRIAAAIAKRALKNGLSKHAIKAIAAYLLEENRSGELSSIMRDVQKEWAENGTVEVIISSAHDFPSASQIDAEQLAREIFPDATRIILTPKHSPELLGGIKLTMPDYQLDGTVLGKLQKFKSLATQERSN